MRRISVDVLLLYDLRWLLFSFKFCQVFLVVPQPSQQRLELPKKKKSKFNLTFEVSIINGERHARLKLLPYHGKTYSDIRDSKLIYFIVSFL